MTSISIDRPMNNLTIVIIGEYEFAFSYQTVVAFYEPTNGWSKSENVWSQTTGRHLNSLPGRKINHDEFTGLLESILESFNATGPVGHEEHAPLPRAWSSAPIH